MLSRHYYNAYSYVDIGVPGKKIAKFIYEKNWKMYLVCHVDVKGWNINRTCWTENRKRNGP